MITSLACLALAWAGADEAPSRRPGPTEKETWSLTLPDAIAIGLNNSESVRVLSLGQPIPVGCRWGLSTYEVLGLGSCPDNVSARMLIARLNADVDPWRFKAEVLALLSTIERRYWDLRRRNVELWACEKAVEWTEAALKRARAEAQASVGVIDTQLEQFRRKLATARLRFVLAERRLREVLGLPHVDTRRIVPATAPTDRKPVLSVRTTNLQQPDRERQAARLREAEWLWNNLTAEMTVTVAEAVREVDMQYQVLQTATEDKQTAQNRLVWAHDKTPADYVDAIGHFVDAVERRARAQAGYHSALAEFEEARGTLLEIHNIEIRQSPRVRVVR